MIDVSSGSCDTPSAMYLALDQNTHMHMILAQECTSTGSQTSQTQTATLLQLHSVDMKDENSLRN